MPQFRKLTASFTIRTGEPPDRVVWHFARTPPIERALTAAHAIDDPAARAKALLAVMTGALQGWEGVLNEEGQPLPYSSEAFFQCIPAGLRAEVLTRWIGVMLGAMGDGEAEQAGPGQEEGAASVVRNESAPAEEQPPDSTPSSSGDEIPSDPRPNENPPQLPFPMETSDRPANEGTFDVPPGPANHEPLAQPALPFSDPTDPAPQPIASPPLEPPDAVRRAPPSAEPSASGPDPRVAQASSLRPLPPDPLRQRSPATQATPPAPAAVSAATPTQPRLSEAQPMGEPLPELAPASPPCADQVCPLLDPGFDWQPVIRPAWEALHKQTCREETAEAAF